MDREADRAALNRRAAELAGWRWEDTGTEFWVFRPDGRSWGYHPTEPPRAPDFLADPARWWPLVERFSRLQGYERLGYEWEGPCFKPEHRYLTAEGYPLGTVCWYVYTVADGRRQWHCAEEPGEAVVRAALYVAEALGLGPEGGADDAD
jgi:hypothetical protein